MSATATDTFGELRRQISWRRQIIDRIDEKEADLARQQERLTKRRQRYRAKNNGFGRPPKKISGLAKSDLRARHNAQIEIKILEKVLRCPRDAVLVDWIEGLERRDYGADAVVARSKLKKLKRQLSPTTPSPNVQQIWDQNTGRQYLKHLYYRQLGRLSPFQRRKAKESWDQKLEDRERARLLVISAVLACGDISSLRKLAVHSALVKAEPRVDDKVHDRSSFVQAWPSQIAWLIDQITQHFAKEDA